MTDKRLKTGDIILYHGKRSLFDKTIEYFTNSRWSHVAIVLRDPVYIDNKLTGLYIWESGSENFVDAQDAKKKVGVQIVNGLASFDECVANQDMYVRRIKFTRPSTGFNQTRMRELEALTRDKPYDINIIDWLYTYLDLPKAPTNNRFWCSAFAAYFFILNGFLPTETNWTMVEPRDFASLPYGGSDNLKWIDCEFEPEEPLTREMWLN